MKDILVHTENFRDWSPVVTYAAALAATLDARLTGLYVCASPTVMMPPYDAPGIMAELLEEVRELERDASAAGNSFATLASQAGADKAAWQVATGYLRGVLERMSNWQDLLVLERPADAPWGVVSALGNIVLTAGLPCIVVPSGYREAPALNCIALAWNGSAEAIRAIHAALPLVVRAGRVLLLQGESRSDFSLGDLGWMPPFDISLYLQQHGVHVEPRPLATHENEAGAALLDAASRRGADLLVMGAWGRSRLSEWILGGATHHVLSHAAMPVFMRH